MKKEKSFEQLTDGFLHFVYTNYVHYHRLLFDVRDCMTMEYAYHLPEVLQREYIVVDISVVELVGRLQAICRRSMIC